MSTITLTPRAAREQQTFRVLLNAMARPGSIDTVPLHDSGAEYAAALSVMEALVDHEVTFALLPERPELVDAVLRQTGSRLEALEQAGYVLCQPDTLSRVLDGAMEGSLEYPDHGATVICRVESIREGGKLALRGPGIEFVTRVSIDGFSDEAMRLLAERNSHPPLGLDLIFVAPDGRLVCLGRYTRITKENN